MVAAASLYHTIFVPVANKAVGESPKQIVRGFTVGKATVFVTPLYAMIVPDAPTAQPVFASLKETPFKLLVVPLVTFVQEVPSYFKIVPPSPTAYPFVALVKYTDLKLFVTPLVTDDHVVPLYFNIVPVAPTAQPVLASNNCTPNKSAVPCVVEDQAVPL